jgi:hypothetical protein
MENWLVISNCQTFGLANCMQAQADDVLVTGVDTLLFNREPERFNAEMNRYSKLFIADGVKGEIPAARFDPIPVQVDLPIMTCRAFHPDLIYLQHDGRTVPGPCGDYHSAIAYACFLKGLNPADTAQYFNGGFFERCGYMGMWVPERDRIIAELSDYGLDMARSIRHWGRQGAFMYSINHPRIHILYDIASELLRNQGRIPFSNNFMPNDNLATGAIFAVYPEIGEALGVAGKYAFQTVGSYRPIGLKSFIESCFEKYQSFEPGTIDAHPHFKGHLNYISALI